VDLLLHLELLVYEVEPAVQIFDIEPALHQAETPMSLLMMLLANPPQEELLSSVSLTPYSEFSTVVAARLLRRQRLVIGSYTLVQLLSSSVLCSLIDLPIPTGRQVFQRGL
jgi:hypothetical protein